MTAVLFPLGRIVATPGALSFLADAGVRTRPDSLRGTGTGIGAKCLWRTRARTTTP
jgi:hypothetical protein